MNQPNLPKKKDSHPHASQAHSNGTVSPVRCTVPQCKQSPQRFEFCQKHYEHFKFGLIKKNGERAADYEKKYEQFLAHQKRHNPRAA